MNCWSRQSFKIDIRSKPALIVVIRIVFYIQRYSTIPNSAFLIHSEQARFETPNMPHLAPISNASRIDLAFPLPVSVRQIITSEYLSGVHDILPQAVFQYTLRRRDVRKPSRLPFSLFMMSSTYTSRLHYCGAGCKT